MVCFCAILSWTIVSIIAAIGFGFWYVKRIHRKRGETFVGRDLKYFPVPNFMWCMIRGKRLEEEEYKAVLENGTVFGTTIFMRPAILIAEPDLIQSIMVKEFTNFTDRRVRTFIYFLYFICNYS